MKRLEGSLLQRPGTPRRLQDPLSFRNIAQVHGSLLAALKVLEDTAIREINSAGDSPVVLLDTQEIVSSGNFLKPYLSIALVGVNQAIAQVAAQITARVSRMLSSRFTDLPSGLSDAASVNAGLGPLTKVTEALFAEIVHLAVPPAIYPSSSADGVEDTVSYAALAGRNLIDICSQFTTLVAIEMIVAAQAIHVRGVSSQIAPSLKPLLTMVAGTCPPLEGDRALSTEIDELAKILARGETVRS